MHNVFTALGDPGNESWLLDVLDPDGDGVWQGGWEPCADASNDADGDGRFDVRDNCLGVFNPNQIDTDGDGWGDACDACPVPDLGFDSDGDGVVDECDRCLGVDDGDDTDGDGVPDGCDNCADEDNPDQRNCNLDAETAIGLYHPDPTLELPGIGDACDQNPCADTEPRTSMIEEGRYFRIGNARFDIDGLAAEAPPEEPFGAQGPGTLGYRACRCSGAESDDPITRELCRLLEGCAIPITSGQAQSLYALPHDDTILRGWKPIELAPGFFATNGFLRIDEGTHMVLEAATLSTHFAEPACVTIGGGEVSCFPDAPGDTVQLATPSVVGWSWILADDVFRFLTPAELAGLTYPRLNAVLWSNVEERPTSPGACGAPGAPRPCAPLDRALSSNYTSGLFRERLVLAPLPGTDLIGPAVLPPRACPECFFGAPAGWLSTECFADEPGCVDPRLVTRFPGPADLDVGEAFSDISRQVLIEPDLVWLGPAEPSRSLPDDAPRLVALSPGGSQVFTQIALAADGVMRTDSPNEPLPPPNLPPPTEPPFPQSAFRSAGCASAVIDAGDGLDGQRERIEHGVAYWGGPGLVLVGGGRDALTGVARRDLRFFRLATKESGLIPLEGPVRPERVLAMAVDYVAGALLILDVAAEERPLPQRPICRTVVNFPEEEGGEFTQTVIREDGCRPPDDVGGRGGSAAADARPPIEVGRLLRVDLTTGTIEQLAVWTDGLEREFGLATTPDGAFYLVSSREPSMTYEVLRLRVDPAGRLVQEGFWTGHGLLRGRPVATGSALSFVVEQRGGTVTPVVVHVDELRPGRRDRFRPPR